MTIEKAILVELFGILLILFAGVNVLTNTYLLSSWDGIGNTTVWLAAGLLVGIYGVVAGLRSDR